MWKLHIPEFPRNPATRSMAYPPSSVLSLLSRGRGQGRVNKKVGKKIGVSPHVTRSTCDVRKGGPLSSGKNVQGMSVCASRQKCSIKVSRQDNRYLFTKRIFTPESEHTANMYRNGNVWERESSSLRFSLSSKITFLAICVLLN